MAGAYVVCSDAAVPSPVGAHVGAYTSRGARLGSTKTQKPRTRIFLIHSLYTLFHQARMAVCFQRSPHIVRLVAEHPVAVRPAGCLFTMMLRRFISCNNISNILRYLYEKHRIIIGNVDKYRGLLSPMMLQSFKQQHPVFVYDFCMDKHTVVNGNDPMHRKKEVHTAKYRWAKAAYVARSSQFYQHFQYFYGICMEEHTIEARIPHINGTVVRK